MSKKYLIKVKKYHWHLFPDAETSQDLNTSGLHNKKLLKIVKLSQKDGSRFTCIYSKLFEGSDMVDRLRYILGKDLDIRFEGNTLEKHHIEAMVKQSKYEYRAYLTHSFLNGTRYVPVIVGKEANCVYNISSYFKEKIPEDDIGVLIKTADDLIIESCKPEIIKYESFKRMCRCCGIVSDFSKPRKNVWLSAKKTL